MKERWPRRGPWLSLGSPGEPACASPWFLDNEFHSIGGESSGNVDISSRWGAWFDDQITNPTIQIPSNKYE